MHLPQGKREVARRLEHAKVDPKDPNFLRLQLEEEEDEQSESEEDEPMGACEVADGVQVSKSAAARAEALMRAVQ
jgi:hypothetical protein